jgi:hypothetical protein
MPRLDKTALPVHRAAALAKERVEALPDGRVRIALKRAWTTVLDTAGERERDQTIQRILAKYLDGVER